MVPRKRRKPRVRRIPRVRRVRHVRYVRHVRRRRRRRRHAIQRWQPVHRGGAPRWRHGVHRWRRWRRWLRLRRPRPRRARRQRRAGRSQRTGRPQRPRRRPRVLRWRLGGGKRRWRFLLRRGGRRLWRWCRRYRRRRTLELDLILDLACNLALLRRDLALFQLVVLVVLAPADVRRAGIAAHTLGSTHQRGDIFGLGSPRFLAGGSAPFPARAPSCALPLRREARRVLLRISVLTVLLGGGRWLEPRRQLGRRHGRCQRVPAMVQAQRRVAESF